MYMLEMSNPNPLKICRLCMSHEGVMVHIFESSETKEQPVPLPIRIMMCVSIKVSLLINVYVVIVCSGE